MTNSDFVALAIQHMVKEGVTLNLVNKKQVKIGTSAVSGLFSASDKKFTLAVGQPEKSWFRVFIHEYCHFLQMLDGPSEHPDSVWIDWNDWIDGNKRLTKSQIKKYCRIIQADELDAEKRVVKLIRKHKLDINIQEYIKDANSYVLMYNVSAKHRAWCNGQAPREIPEIQALMPSTFIKSLGKCPAGFEALVVENCFKKS